jgi:hypothetical protein
MSIPDSVPVVQCDPPVHAFAWQAPAQLLGEQ